MKTTCLHARHEALGGRMVDFAGWHMPIQYQAGILEEHRAVRESVGMFDVSHMGRIEFSGADCVPYLQRFFTCDVAALQRGQGRYTLMCTEDGGILDDTIVYCRRPDSFLLVCNAANTTPVLAWLRQWKQPGQRVNLQEVTAVTGMIALQGPESPRILSQLADPAVLEGLAYFHWTETGVRGSQAAVARTGYTGEDGFEIIGTAPHVEALWDSLVELKVSPCGLGARDTLRLEAALPLHGNDISPRTNPIEAGLGWAVALEKPASFLGQAAIRRVKEVGPERRLVGFELRERGVPRAHCPLLHDGQAVGEATSGGWAPTLRKGIGMGYLPMALAKIGTPIEVDIRGTRAPATVVRRPFYKRPKSPLSFRTHSAGPG